MRIKKILPITLLLAGFTFFGCNKDNSFSKSFYDILDKKDTAVRMERIEKYLNKQGILIELRELREGSKYITDNTYNTSFRSDSLYFHIKVQSLRDENKENKRLAFVSIKGNNKHFDYDTFEKGIFSLLKGDFVKIHDVKYDPNLLEDKLLEDKLLEDKIREEEGIKNYRILKVDVEGFDGEGINWFTFILDGKTLSKSFPGELKENPYRLEKTGFKFGIEFESDLYPMKYKEEHNLRVIMEDKNGNKIDDTYLFEVK